jgi:hypothetical protein
VCQTLSPDGSTFGDCSHRGVTGGSGTVDPGPFMTGGVIVESVIVRRSDEVVGRRVFVSGQPELRGCQRPPPAG